MKKRVIILMALLLLSVSAFPFPEVDQYGYYGKIFYSSKRHHLGYIINRYNDSKQKIREEVYDPDGILIKYEIFEYDSSNLLIKQIEFNRNKKQMKEISYVNANKKPKKRIVKQGNKLTLYVDYDYSFYNNRLLYRTETFYYKEHHKEPHRTIIKRSMFTYKKWGEKLIEHFKKDVETDRDFKYQSAEIYKYSPSGKILGIIHLDEHRRPRKYFKYLYGSDNKIWKINIYKSQSPVVASAGGFRDFLKSDFVLKNTIVHEYSADRFKSVKALELAQAAETKKVVPDPIKTFIIKPEIKKGDDDEADDDDDDDDDDEADDDDDDDEADDDDDDDTADDDKADDKTDNADDDDADDDDDNPDDDDE